MASDFSSLEINLFDGTRELLSDGSNILFRVFDGNQKQVYNQFKRTPSLLLPKLPFYDNFGDNYTVIAWAKGYRQAGFSPLKLSPSHLTRIDLILIPNEPELNFADAPWDAIEARLPFLAHGVSETAGRDRYNRLMEEKPKSLAALLNITTAMEQILLPVGNPVDYLREIQWDDCLAQDRFFAYCDAKLIDQVRAAAREGLFAPEMGSGFFHPGATASWKQVQFGEANVQLTFHEGKRKKIGGIDCILVEPDIDYYKDLAAHALLEVIPNTFTHGLTNPEVVYVLRWMAGRHAGVPEFDPPYVIEKEVPAAPQRRRPTVGRSRSKGRKTRGK
jgi:hypothetical protein